jgi:glyoxylase-like metal-dependent hydrolase (beta-lactamase superfamily II)
MSKIHLQVFTFNPFQENTYVVWDETRECIIIDPGCYEKHEHEELTSFIEINNLKVTEVLNTHCHIDHVLGNRFVKEYYKVKLTHHRKEESTHRAVKAYAPNYGFVMYEEAMADRYVEEGDKIRFGNTILDIVFVPGHSPGHVAFYDRDEKICLGGDVLFYDSIGRTDLPGGDYETLIESIHQKLFTMPDDMVVYPGHGPKTTIGREKKVNPFCAVG